MTNEADRLRHLPVRSRTRLAPKAAIPNDERHDTQFAGRSPEEVPTATSCPPNSEPHDRPSSDGREYEVGYAKPPTHSRFKPGQSGNPNGRPKLAQSLNTIVRKRLIEPVQVKTASGIKRVSRVDALLMKAIDEGGKGQLRAIEKLLAMYAAAVPEPHPKSVSPGPTNASDISAADEETLRLLRADIAAELQQKKLEGPEEDDENA